MNPALVSRYVRLLLQQKRRHQCSQRMVSSAGCAALLQYVDSTRRFRTGLNLFVAMATERRSAQRLLETVAAAAFPARVFRAKCLLW